MKKFFNILVYIFAIIGFVLIVVFLAVQFGFTNSKGIVDEQHDYFKEQIEVGIENNKEAWKNSEEWLALKQAIVKDKAVIDKVAQETGISSRIIVTPLVVEQMRLFSSEREVFKAIFAPLKILGNQSQFSWGVMGIKQDTAIQIEKNLKDANSPFYLGTEFENKLDFKTADINDERFNRMANEKDRYYSYLYGALFLKEIEAQWQKAGFPIDNRPEILATIYNIGFKNSKPKANPQSGGAEITIGENTDSHTYSFGGLGKLFYSSQELITEFPDQAPRR